MNLISSSSSGGTQIGARCRGASGKILFQLAEFQDLLVKFGKPSGQSLATPSG